MMTNKYPTHPNTKNRVDRGETCEGFLPYDVRMIDIPVGMVWIVLAAILCLICHDTIIVLWSPKRHFLATGFTINPATAPTFRRAHTKFGTVLALW